MTIRAFFLWALFMPTIPWALEPQGPLALSMSGSGRAITKGAEYHLLNPASLIHFKGTQGSGFYIFGSEPAHWGVSLVENQQVPLGLSYIKDWGSSNQYLSMSTAGFIVPGWSLGLSLSRWQDTEQAHWNVQGGVLINPPQSPLSIGATYDHLLPLRGAFEGHRKWGLGFNFQLYEWLSLRTDVLYNTESQWAVAGGATATVSRFLVLRVANRWVNKQWLFSGGLGLTAKNMALDYGVSQKTDTKRWQNSLSVRFTL